jgi:hypothetical protein
MKQDGSSSEYLVISRGQWDKHLSREEIQKAIDGFYAWKDELVAAGKMRSGQRLARDGKTVSRSIVTDGPFGETKELIGGYWFVIASSLDEAAKIMQGSPCLACGLFCEIRPIDPARASAYIDMTESPRR